MSKDGFFLKKKPPLVMNGSMLIWEGHGHARLELRRDVACCWVTVGEGGLLLDKRLVQLAGGQILCAVEEKARDVTAW